MVSKQTVTLANSIVGVSVLAMPFCFKQCGVILATLMLILGAVITRTVCYFLLKAGTITRRRNYEMLAWHTFGQGGKFIVEIGIIGFLFGTLIAFFVVMGDLGPEIVSEVFSIENNYSLRNIIMTALSLFVALPLGLLRNMDSLSSVSTASILFYVFLVFEIFCEGLGPLFSGSYLDRIDYWRPAGVLQCIPILSMALSCQTQIFAIYESLPDPTLQKMNVIVKHAVTICTIFYFCVGFFGYIAFCHQNFGGNILMTLSSSWTTQLIKLCFLMSIVFSVPLVVFPCRASLNSLIFRRVHMHHSLHDISTNYIPDGRLKLLTIFIIGCTLVIGILIPNIELVLGLVGSTTGSVICIIFPSIMFIQVTSKQTTERLLAQVIFCTGIVTMVVSTYATLYATDQAVSNLNPINDPLPDQIRISEIIAETKYLNSKASFQAPDTKIVEMSEDLKHKLDDLKKLKMDSDKSPDKPSLPSAPNIQTDLKHEEENLADPSKMKGKMKLPDADGTKQEHSKSPSPLPVDSVNQNQSKVHPEKPNEGDKLLDHNDHGDKDKTVVDGIKAEVSSKPEAEPERENKKDADDTVSSAKLNFPEPISGIGENKAAVHDKSPTMEKDSAVDILKKLEVHQENQKKLLEEQRKILEELKEHHEIDVHRQQQSDKVQTPLKADELINAVAREEAKNQEDEINQDVIDKKVEVLQQEKLIEKLSENLEKEKENVKIIEKIEAGLNEEIVKIDEAEPKLKETVKLPDPVPNPNNHEIPIAVGEKVGNVLQNIKESQNPHVPDPDIIVQKQGLVDVNAPASLSKQMLKPIPIQDVDSLRLTKGTKQDLTIPSINTVNSEDKAAPTKNKTDIKQENQHEEKKSDTDKLSLNFEKMNVPTPKTPKRSEPVKQVDRDI